MVEYSNRDWKRWRKTWHTWYKVLNDLASIEDIHSPEGKKQRAKLEKRLKILQIAVGKIPVVVKSEFLKHVKR